ncbi:MAG: hypothetical protein H0W83_04360, partial [Planctomycetes bacterium]|nr:hypothetical protein [Planctomycetota bacterium]
MDTIDQQVPRRWSWSRAATHVQRDLLLFVIGLAALGAVRIVFIGIFHRHLGPGAGTLPLLSVMFNGMRFDGRIAIVVVAPTLLVSLCALRWAVGSWLAILRLALGWTFLSLTVLLAAVDVGFFVEYDDQFNHFVLGAFYDDFAAIVKTVWAEHHVVLFLCAWLAAIAAIGWI